MSENLQHGDTTGPGTAGERSPDDLEREIAGTRASIDSTVGELGQRLSPRQLAEDAREYVRESATRGATNAWTRISETTREHAVPFALIGSGIALYMWSGRAEQRYGRNEWQPGRGSRYRYEGDFGEGYETFEGGKGTRRYAGPHEPSGSERAIGAVSGLVSRTGEAARHATERVRERTSRLGSRAQGGLERARGGLDQVRREQPLLLGLASIALGALVGGAIPSTSREDELLGEVRDRALDKVAEVGQQTAEQMRQAGGAGSEQGRSGNGDAQPRSGETQDGE
jgi:hypothetical protein